MVDKCIRCKVRGDRVRLYDAIYDGRMNLLCERCSIIENVPIIRKPDTEQLKKCEVGDVVYKRMRRIAGYNEENNKGLFFREDRLKELNENPDLELPEEEKLNLIDHFHWEVMKERRRKGLSQKKLSEAIGESESVIQMIESGKLPEDSGVVVRKLEQIFQRRLRKIREIDIIMKKKEMERVNPMLFDEDGNPIEVIPEPELENLEEESEDSKTPLPEGVNVREYKVKNPNFSDEEGFLEEADDKTKDDESLEEEFLSDEPYKDVDLKKIDKSRIKISDLKRLHSKKMEIDEEEKKKEMEKKMERLKLIEKQKEVERRRKEEEKRELDKFLGGTELIGDFKSS